MSSPNQPLPPSRTALAVEAAFDRLGRVRASVWLLVGVLVVAGFATAAIVSNSLVIDGTRYHWLDDDQMIAMRYARNLASGDGPVWNAGERVEGYSNFLWMVVMAGVHLLPLADAHTSLAVDLINAALACCVLLLTARLLFRLVPEPGPLLPAVLALVVFSHELLFWSLHGFETTLLTVVFLFVLLRVLNESLVGNVRWTTWALMGVLPLVRADGFHLWAAAALVAAGLAGRFEPRSLLATVLPAAHLLFRRLYYGDWLPNTYYLKVEGHTLSERLDRGVDYAAYFLLFYWLIILLAGLGALVAADRRRRLLFAGFALSLAYVIWVGGDNFYGARFLAPQAPLLVVLAAVGVRQLADRKRLAELAMLAAAVGSYWTFAGFLTVYGSGFTLIANPNGGPRESVVTAVAIRENTEPEARVAVHAAGIVPYFSRRPAIDLLGKSDTRLAHLPPQNVHAAHDKLDPDYSLGERRADLAVMLWLPRQLGSCTERDRALVARTVRPWVAAVYLSDVFQREFCRSVVELPGASPVYVRRSSRSLARDGVWREPRVGS